jgi:hypothetical protein
MISNDIQIHHLQSESVIQEMADEDTWLAIGAGASIAVFGMCVLYVSIRRCYTPHPTLKQSRSDNDLESMIAHEDPRS